MKSATSWWWRVAIAAALVVIGCWPWDGLRREFSTAFSEMVSPLLEQVTFDGQTSVAIGPLGGDAVVRPKGPGTEHIVADTALTLRLAKYAGQLQVEVSLRRDVFLPLVLFGAMVLVAPIPWRRRLATVGIGYAVIGATAIASILLLLANIFSGRLPLAPQLSEVYPVSETWGNVLQFLYERWLTPPGNRVIAPLLLGALAWIIHIDYWWPSSSTFTADLNSERLG